jgi:hypothetical protein
VSATSGVLVGGGGDNVAAVNVAGTTGANAAQNNRLLHPGEAQKAKELAAKSGGKYTQKQIEDALRNASDSATGENITTGMAIKNPADPNAITDKGAVFNTGGDGKSVVQVLPNAGNVDPELAARIQKDYPNYSWSNEQLGKVSPLRADPNAAIKMQVDPNWSYMGSNSAGMPSGTAKVPDGSYGVGLYPGVTPGGEVEVQVQNGSVVGAKVGVGFGVGGHLNLGTQSVGGGLLKGPVSGAEGNSFFELNPLQAGEARIGPSASVNVGVGSAGLETGYAAGASVNNAGVKGYENVTITPTIAPVIPKISAEIKVNVIELSVKPPAPIQPTSTGPEGGSK